MKKIAKKIILLSLLIFSILLISCTLKINNTYIPDNNLNYELVIIKEKGCSNKSAYMNITENNTFFKLNGIVQVPNPCYDIKREIKTKFKDIEINITTEPGKDFCIQCIGAYSIEGKFSKRYYKHIKIYVNGKLVAEK